MSHTKKLSNRLVEGFLFTFLVDWKSSDEICAAVLDHFGKDVCNPDEVGKDGSPKYQTKIENVLTMGVKNQVYEFDEANNKYKIK